MSGGEFQYAYSRVELFAEELREKLEDPPERIFNHIETYFMLRQIEDVAALAAKLIREAELLYSSDIGEEVFLDTASDLMSDLRDEDA